MEPRTPDWKESVLLTKLQSQHAGTRGTESGGVRKREERRRVEGASKKGSETGGVERARRTRKRGEKRKARFPTLGDPGDSARRLCNLEVLEDSSSSHIYCWEIMHL